MLVKLQSLNIDLWKSQAIDNQLTKLGLYPHENSPTYKFNNNYSNLSYMHMWNCHKFNNNTNSIIQHIYRWVQLNSSFGKISMLLSRSYIYLFIHIIMRSSEQSSLLCMQGRKHNRVRLCSSGQSRREMSMSPRRRRKPLRRWWMSMPQSVK